MTRPSPARCTFTNSLMSSTPALPQHMAAPAVVPCVRISSRAQIMKSSVGVRAPSDVVPTFVVVAPATPDLSGGGRSGNGWRSLAGKRCTPKGETHSALLHSGWWSCTTEGGRGRLLRRVLTAVSVSFQPKSCPSTSTSKFMPLTNAQNLLSARAQQRAVAPDTFLPSSV